MVLSCLPQPKEAQGRSEVASQTWAKKDEEMSGKTGRDEQVSEKAARAGSEGGKGSAGSTATCWQSF